MMRKKSDLFDAPNAVLFLVILTFVARLACVIATGEEHPQAPPLEDCRPYPEAGEGAMACTWVQGPHVTSWSPSSVNPW